MQGLKVTVCIPTMNRFDQFLAHSIPQYLAMDCVERVIVTDETGDDVRKIQQQPWAQTHAAKLCLFVNKRQLGAYGNKTKCVQLAPPNAWVALMDSDNFAPEDTYFRPWQQFVSERPHEDHTKTIFAPGTAVNPQTGALSVFTLFDKLDISNVGTAIKEFQLAYVVLNTGNFIVLARTYNSVASAASGDLVLTRLVERRPMMASCDAALKCLQLFTQGCTLRVVPSMSYQHAVHAGSLFLQRGETSEEQVNMSTLMRRARELQAQWRQSHPLDKPTTPLPAPSESTRRKQRL